MVGEASKHNGLGGFEPLEALKGVLKQHGSVLGGFALSPSAPWVGQGRISESAQEEQARQDKNLPQGRISESKETEELSRAKANIEKAIAAIDDALKGASQENAAALNGQKQNLAALRAQLALGFRSGARLEQIVHAAQAAASNASASAAIVSAGGSIGGAGAHIAAAEYQRAAAESRNWLSSTAEQFEKTTNASSALAARYGIDVSEHEKKIEEARKREKEAIAKGDVAGALHARIEGLDAAIDKSDQIIDDPRTPKDKKEEEQRRKEELIKKREEAKAQEQKKQEKKLEEKVQKGEMTKEEKDKALGETKTIDAQKTAALQGQTIAVVDKNVSKITNNAGKIDDSEEELEKFKNPNPKSTFSLASPSIVATHSTSNQIGVRASLAAKAAVANIENKPIDPVAAGNDTKQPTQVASSTETKSSPKIGG